MIVRIIKPIVTSLGGFNPGEVIAVPDKIAKSWIKAGLATENKAITPNENK